MAWIQICDDYAPLFIVIQNGSPEGTEAKKNLKRFHDLLLESEKVVSLVDLRQAKRPSPAERLELSLWIKNNLELLKTHCEGAALVIPHPIVRAALKALLFNQDLPMRHLVCETIEEAFDWSVSLLGEQGIQVDPKAKQFLLDLDGGTSPEPSSP